MVVITCSNYNCMISTGSCSNHWMISTGSYSNLWVSYMSCNPPWSLSHWAHLARGCEAKRTHLLSFEWCRSSPPMPVEDGTTKWMEVVEFLMKTLKYKSEFHFKLLVQGRVVGPRNQMNLWWKKTGFLCQDKSCELDLASWEQRTSSLPWRISASWAEPLLHVLGPWEISGILE